MTKHEPKPLTVDSTFALRPGDTLRVVAGSTPLRLAVGEVWRVTAVRAAARGRVQLDLVRGFAATTLWVSHRNRLQEHTFRATCADSSHGAQLALQQRLAAR